MGRPEDAAFQRRRAHSSIEAMSGRILQAVGYPSKRHRDFICALQSAHGSGEDARVAFTPFKRAHLTLAKYMEIKGELDSQRMAVYREILTLRKFTNQTGILLFHVTPGSEEETTEYIDYLTPAADEAMQRALSSDLWKTDKKQAIEESVKWAVEQLPRVDKVLEEEEETKVLSLDEYTEQQIDRVFNSIEKAFDGMEDRHGDPDDCLAALDRIYAKAIKAIGSRRKTLPARKDFAHESLGGVVENRVSGNKTIPYKSDLPM